jgi:hypothetical protein
LRIHDLREIEGILHRQQPITKISKICLVISVIGLFSGLLAFSYMGSYMRVIGDDYFYGSIFKQYGFWGGQIQAYMNPMLFHGDRFTLNFFSLFFSLFPPKINALIPSIVVCIFIATLYFFITSLTTWINLSITKLLRLTISLAIGFFTLWLAPTVKQGLYWRSSMLPSLAPIIGTVFLASFILLHRQVKWKAALFTFLFALINSGFSENGAAYQAMMSVILIIMGFLLRSRKAQNAKGILFLSILTLIASILGVVIMWLSPGIANYHGDLSNTPFSTLILSIRYAFNHYKEMIISRFIPLTFLIVLGFSAYLINIKSNKNWLPVEKKKISFWIMWLLIIQAITFLFILSLTIPSAFVRNVYPDPRHFMGSIMVIVITMLASGLILGVIIEGIIQQYKQAFSKIIILITLFLFTGINFVYPIWTIPQITNERLKFQYWANQWDERNHEIIMAAANDEEQIHVLRMDHIIEGVAELGPDPTNPWYNLPASQYYGIEIIADLPGWDEGLSEFIRNK